MLKPKKSLGQNFLTDKTVASQMVNALEIGNGESVVEIGPGRGIVTTHLIEKAKPFDTKIIAVELDTSLYRDLKNIYSKVNKAEFVNENILDWLPEFTTDRNIKIIGSIPYYITSPIIHKIIRMQNVPEIVVLLVQKEVAEKIKDKPPDSSYLSSFIQTFFDVRYLGKVPSKKFNPKPQVDGGILKMTKREVNFTSQFIKKYEGFLHRAYSNPRKMLNKIFRQEELEKGKIDPRLRAQNLGAQDWLDFYKVLNEF